MSVRNPHFLSAIDPRTRRGGSAALLGLLKGLMSEWEKFTFSTADESRPARLRGEIRSVTAPGQVDRSPQFRLNRFLTSCPEIISVKDNRVSGTVVAELPFATAGVLTNGG